jgi:hypothetical protein
MVDEYELISTMIYQEEPVLLPLHGNKANDIADVIIAYPGTGIRWYMHHWNNQFMHDPMIHLDKYGTWRDKTDYGSWILTIDRFKECLSEHSLFKHVYLIGYMNNWKEIVDYVLARDDLGIGTLICLQTRYIENVIKYRQSHEYTLNDLPIVKTDLEVDDYLRLYLKFVKELVEHLNKTSHHIREINVKDHGLKGELEVKIWRRENY